MFDDYSLAILGIVHENRHLYIKMYAGDFKNSYSREMESAPCLDEAVASVIKQLRAQHGYTQEQLAGFAKTSRSQIAQLEVGARGTTLNSLYWISESFNLKFTDIISMIENTRSQLIAKRGEYATSK